MKKFALLAVLLSISISLAGCDSKKKEAPKTDAGAPPATTPPAETK